MSKRQLITQIQELNESAPARFLAQFDAAALKQYLEHLKTAQKRTVRIGKFVRREPGLRMVS